MPDRASDFDDIPTYAPGEEKKASGSAQGNATANAYSRAGRVAPQSITPDAGKKSADAAAAASGAADAKNETEVLPKQAAESEETTVLSKQGGYSNDHNARLASDAPTSNYDDDDFAPRGGSSEPTTVFTAEPAPAPASVPASSPEPTRVIDTGAPVYASAPEPAPAAAPAPLPAEPLSADAAPVVQAKRGTMDFGLLILRVAVSAYLLLDSIRVFFNMGANGGLNQLEEEFSSYAAPNLLAIGVPAMELAAGVFLLFGLLTPVAAAVGTAATTFLLGHFVYTADSLAIFDMPDKVWLGLLLSVATLTLQFTGPGWISFDVSRSWAKRPLYSSWIFALLSVAGAVALWWFGAGLNPLA